MFFRSLLSCSFWVVCFLIARVLETIICQIMFLANTFSHSVVFVSYLPNPIFFQMKQASLQGKLRLKNIILNSFFQFTDTFCERFPENFSFKSTAFQTILYINKSLHYCLPGILTFQSVTNCEGSDVSPCFKLTN